MRIARILHRKETPFGRPHSDRSGLFLFVPDLAGCIIVTIELLNPHQCSIGPRGEVPPSYIYAAALRAFPAERISRPRGPIKVFLVSCRVSESPDFRCG